MKIRFTFDPHKCSACGACAIACMDQNDIDIAGGQAPYRRVYQHESDTAHVYMSVACLHCADAPCAAACPMECLYKDGATGLTLYDTACCIGCRACGKACPYDAITFRPREDDPRRVRMEKCRGCPERIAAGLEPACVQACPTGAIAWHWAEEAEENPLQTLYALYPPADI